MQLSHGYDEINFPFVIATNLYNNQVFFVNVNTRSQVPLINLEDCIDSKIYNIQQTSKFAVTKDDSKANNYNNLQEIILHYTLQQKNKQKVKNQLFYC